MRYHDVFDDSSGWGGDDDSSDGDDDEAVVTAASGRHQTRVVLSNSMSTAWSMGWIIMGMDAKPVAVGNHFCIHTGNIAMTGNDFRTANRLALTIKLMVAPGIMTLANDCHSNTSNVARTVSCRACCCCCCCSCCTVVVAAVVGVCFVFVVVVLFCHVSQPVLPASAKQYPKETAYDGKTSLGNWYRKDSPTSLAYPAYRNKESRKILYSWYVEEEEEEATVGAVVVEDAPASFTLLLLLLPCCCPSSSCVMLDVMMELVTIFVNCCTG